jgi:hypothetical protein
MKCRDYFLCVQSTRRLEISKEKRYAEEYAALRTELEKEFIQFLKKYEKKPAEQYYKSFYLSKN